MKNQLKLMIGNNKMKMPADEARELLGRVAERIHVDRHHKELAPLLEQKIGHAKVGMELNDFLSLRPRPGRLFSAYSGPCVLKNPETANKQRSSIDEIDRELGDYVDGNIHGATMWGFIKDIHDSSIRTRKLSIGVMPWRGLWDLKTIASSLPADFPRMHYLAIVGEDYGDHANVFGALPDSVILLGGRKGAYLEAMTAKRQGKFIICYDIEGGSEAIATFENGKIVLPSVTNVVSFMKRNLIPEQRIFHGETCEFEEFDRHLMEQKIVNLGFVSTSGAFTNYPYFKQVLEDLLVGGIPAEIAEKVEETSGGTRYGGVWEMYDEAKKVGIRRNGLMCGKGLDLPWCDVDKMVYVGNEWGDESQRFTYASDILVGFSGGKQAKEEMKRAAQSGGRYPWKNGIPVVALYDELTNGATCELHNEGFTHPNMHYFHTNQLTQAAQFLKQCIRQSHKEKK